MRSDEPIVTVVVPMYNEEAVAQTCHRRLSEVLESLGTRWEIIYVNDGSRDGTRGQLDALAAADVRVTAIHFVRNFGHQAAITAGMDAARGEAIIVIDSDLQDPPELMPELLAQWEAGYDVVYARRRRRAGETWFKKASAAAFYRFIDSMSEVRLPLDVGDYRLIDRRVRDALGSLGEHNRYVRGLIAWLGFRQTYVDYDRAARLAGETKYPLGKMIKLALDGITAFSRKPLQLASLLGFVSAAGGFAALLWVLYIKLFTTQAIDGWASLLGITLVGFGLVFFVLGIMGEYIGRLYEEAKGRPHYLVDEVRRGGAAVASASHPGSAQRRSYRVTASGPTGDAPRS